MNVDTIDISFGVSSILFVETFPLRSNRLFKSVVIAAENLVFPDYALVPCDISFASMVDTLQRLIVYIRMVGYDPFPVHLHRCL